MGGRTVDKLAPEYCLLWINHWSACMTKAEWSGWVQAIFSVVAIVATALIVNYQQKAQRLAERNAIVRRELEEVEMLRDVLQGAASRYREYLSDVDAGTVVGEAYWAELSFAGHCGGRDSSGFGISPLAPRLAPLASGRRQRLLGARTHLYPLHRWPRDERRGKGFRSSSSSRQGQRSG